MTSSCHLSFHAHAGAASLSTVMDALLLTQLLYWMTECVLP